MTLEGIDVSVYQTTTPSLSGLSFVFARAGYGVSADAMYVTHAANVRKAGLVLGAYWFWEDGHDGAAQAAAFLSIAGKADLLALDFEGANTDTAGAKAFIAAVKATGRKCGLYHSLSGYPSFGQDFNWVAVWLPTPPTIPWQFWQYRGSPLDLDRFNGTQAQLNALAGIVPPPVPKLFPGGKLYRPPVVGNTLTLGTAHAPSFRAIFTSQNFPGTPNPWWKVGAGAPAKYLGYYVPRGVLRP